MRQTDFWPRGRGIPSARLRVGPKVSPGGASNSNRLKEQKDFGPNPGALRMFVYAPPKLAAKAPLVVVLHGCGQTAEGYDHGAGWTTLADRLGFVVLAAEQTAANNMNTCFNWFQPGDIARDEGEAASIRQMIGKVVTDYHVDPRRVFITGLSAGGAMTAAMLAAYPEIFAGGAVIAGLPYGAAANVPEALNAMRHAPRRSADVWAETARAASPHKGPWPILSVWHGDADTIVHHSNADAIVEQWTALHGMPAAPTVTQTESTHARRSWHRPDGAAVLESYTLPGMAHGTPVRAGAGDEFAGNPGPYFIEAGVASTLKIAEFWGLDRRLRQPREKPAASDKVKKPRPVHPVREEIHVASAEEPQTRPRPAPPQPKGLHGVIVKALQAAGLMKD